LKSKTLRILTLHRSLVKNIEEKSIATYDTIQITDFAEDTYVGGSSTFDKNTNKRSNTEDIGLYSSVHTNAAGRSIPYLYLMRTRTRLVH